MIPFRRWAGEVNPFWWILLAVIVFTGIPFFALHIYQSRYLAHFFGELERRRVAMVGEATRKPEPKPEPNVRRVFEEDGVRCLEIRGHLFLLSRIVNHGHGSVGSTSFLHAPFCPCHTNANSEAAQ